MGDLLEMWMMVSIFLGLAVGLKLGMWLYFFFACEVNSPDAEECLVMMPVDMPTFRGFKQWHCLNPWRVGMATGIVMITIYYQLLSEQPFLNLKFKIYLNFDIEV